ncbi:MAG: hypothetical protein M3301_09765 [Chloroflexota bacterium]|nr:hypothetical protein [Chloroflexota bacterium]
MAIFASLFAAAGRFLGRALTTLTGWASILLFGQVPESKQLLLSVVTFGSLIWVATVVGVVVPDFGTILVGLVPRPGFIPEAWVRLAMLVAVLVIPLLIGIGGLVLMKPEQRPKGLALLKQVARGYLYAAVVAGSLVFLAVIALFRKLRSATKRWSDAHVPVTVKPGGYDRVADDLEAVLDEAGLAIERRRAPRVLETPAKILAWAGGEGVRSMVPDKLAALASDNLEVFIYPSDILVAGTKAEMARGRAAMASRLTFTAAYLTSTEESQAIEDRLERIAHAIPDRATAGRELDDELGQLHEELAALDVEYEEWEVLYRLRLQVERDLLRKREEAQAGQIAVEPEPPVRSVTERAVEAGLGAGYKLAADAIDRVLPTHSAGPSQRGDAREEQAAEEPARREQTA